MMLNYQSQRNNIIFNCIKKKLDNKIIMLKLNSKLLSSTKIFEDGIVKKL